MILCGAAHTSWIIKAVERRLRKEERLRRGRVCSNTSASSASYPIHCVLAGHRSLRFHPLLLLCIAIDLADCRTIIILALVSNILFPFLRVFLDIIDGHRASTGFARSPHKLQYLHPVFFLIFLSFPVLSAPVISSSSNLPGPRGWVGSVSVGAAQGSGPLSLGT